MVGILGSRIDNRKLLSAGFLGFAVCSFIFGTVNLSIGPYTLLIPITLTGFALSFVFVPLSTMMMATISNKNMGAATGLANMLRNIGGSVGIAMATTAIIRRADLHQTYLSAKLTPSGAVLQQKSALITGYLGRHIGPPGARPGSFGLIYGLMQQQAAMLAYVDVFRWTAVLAVICACAAWLFQKPTQHIKPPQGMH
jgi:DHA2 family multidrug resistance protein